MTIALVMLVLAAPVAAFAAAWWWWLARPRPRQSGSLAIPGLGAEVRIAFDARGVAHVRCASLEDACAAQGYLHAQERLWQMEITRRTARGRLCELFGARALPADRFLRRIGLARAAQREAQQLRPREAAVLAAYARGVNAGIAAARGRRPPELVLLGIQPEPWTEADTLAIGKLMALELAANLDAELVRARLADTLGVERASEIARGLLTMAPAIPGNQPIPSAPVGGHREAIADALALYLTARAELPKMGGGGSNAIAVAGRHTASGKPMLANDPHLSLQLPALWHEIHLVAGEVDLYGAAIPGSPLVLMGHTPHLAWGMTNSYADCQDCWLEQLDAGGTTVRERTGRSTLTVVEERIAVRGAPDHVERCLASARGPLIGVAGEQGMSLSWTALTPGHTMEAIIGLAEARSLDQALQALEHWHAPAQTMVLAATEGRIARVMVGTIPRRAGDAGLLPMPAWGDAPGWDGAIAPNATPREIDPADGLVISANEAPADCPPGLGVDFPPPHRARRLRARLAEAIAAGPLQQDTLRRIQCDDVSEPARALARLMRERARPGPDSAASAMGTRLNGWNGSMAADNPQALVAGAVLIQLCRHALTPTLGTAAQLALGKPVLNPLSSGSLLLGRAPSALVAALERRDTAFWKALGHDDTDALLEAAAAAAAADADVPARMGIRTQRPGWGNLHYLQLQHPLARGGRLLAALFGSQLLKLGGDSDTPCQSGALAYDDANPYRAEGPCVSWRQVVDLGARAQAQSVMPGGQWGIPWSRHYTDQLASWQQGTLLPQHHDLGGASAPVALRLSPLAPRAR